MLITFLIGVIFVVHFVLFVLPFAFGWIGKMMGKFVRKTRNFNKDDFEKNKEYYRDVLKVNSPLIIGYLDNF